MVVTDNENAVDRIKPVGPVSDGPETADQMFAFLRGRGVYAFPYVIGEHKTGWGKLVRRDQVNLAR